MRAYGPLLWLGGPVVILDYLFAAVAIVVDAIARNVAAKRPG
ncbi:hypothetical protein AB4Y89_24490 [Terriglobus sp. 2YAB30_2]